MRLLRPNRILWIAVGAAGAYFFDPDNGPTRRAMLADKVAAKRRGMVDDQAPSPFTPSPTATTPRTTSDEYQPPVASTVGVPGDGTASSHVG